MYIKIEATYNEPYSTAIVRSHARGQEEYVRRILTTHTQH